MRVSCLHITASNPLHSNDKHLSRSDLHQPLEVKWRLGRAGPQASDVAVDHGDVDKSLLRRGCMFITATEPAVLGQPGVGALDDPANGQLDKAFSSLGSGDDHDLAAGLPLLDELGEAGLLVSGV